MAGRRGGEVGGGILTGGGCVVMNEGLGRSGTKEMERGREHRVVTWMYLW